MKGKQTDTLLPIVAVSAGVLSIVASFGVIYALHRVEILIEKAIGKYDEEKGDFDDTLMALADVIQKRKK